MIKLILNELVTTYTSIHIYHKYIMYYCKETNIRDNNVYNIDNKPETEKTWQPEYYVMTKFIVFRLALGQREYVIDSGAGIVSFRIWQKSRIS